MTIANLYFGKDDAETDFTSSGLLQGSFLKTAIFDQIKSRSKSLVIGRKGSGKSALCLILKKELNREKNICLCSYS
jgi:ABC-type multidrug transport system fused ATPase/permease subunit